MANIIDGKAYAEQILRLAKNMIERALERHGRPPVLAIIQVGDDPASNIYVRNKVRAAESIGMEVMRVSFDEDATQRAVEESIDSLVFAGVADGIIVQHPLPQHMDYDAIVNRIPLEKDVDGATRLAQIEEEAFMPCTPYGVLAMLDMAGYKPDNKNVVIIGRSDRVGRPLARILSKEPYNATVTLCHSHTSREDLTFLCQHADIIVTAAGVPDLITENMVRSNACIIDVGINRDATGKLCGDVDFENISKLADIGISPVPGGVGPMTVAALMMNTTLAWVWPAEGDDEVFAWNSKDLPKDQ